MSNRHFETGTFTCLNCGETFEGRIYDPDKPRVFCNPQCRQAYNNHPSRNPAKSPEARIKIGNAQRGNKNCVGRIVSNETRNKIRTATDGKHGKGVKRNPSSPETKKKISEYRRGRFTGADNPNWRGGTSPRDWKTTRYKQFLGNVWANARGICQDCGISGVRMEVHHIKPWIEAPDLRYDPSNGLLLCTPCHHVREKRVITENGKQRISAFSKTRERRENGTFKPVQDEEALK